MKTITISNALSSTIINSLKELSRANTAVSSKMYATSITLKNACASMSTSEKQAISAIKKAIAPEKWGVSSDQWKHFSAVVQSWSVEEITAFRDNGIEFAVVYEGRRLPFDKVMELGSRKAVREYLKSLKDSNASDENGTDSDTDKKESKGTNCPYTKAELLKFIMDKGLYDEFLATMK